MDLNVLVLPLRPMEPEWTCRLLFLRSKDHQMPRLETTPNQLLLLVAQVWHLLYLQVTLCPILHHHKDQIRLLLLLPSHRDRLNHLVQVQRSLLVCLEVWLVYHRDRFLFVIQWLDHHCLDQKDTLRPQFQR